MALADLNPRSTAKVLIESNFTGADGLPVYLDDVASATAGVAVIDISTKASDTPFGVIVVGAASDTGVYPAYATSCELYDTLIGCFDGALAGAGGVSVGDLVSAGTGGFVTNNTPAAAEWTYGIALTSAAAGEQFTIKFAVQQCCDGVTPPPPPTPA